MKPRNDDGPFPKSVFPTSVFPRRIFPWMGGEDEEDEQNGPVKPDQHPETEDEEDE